MKVIITGATGMIGKGVLLECLDDERVTKVLVLGRNSVGIKHPKLHEEIHKDFSTFHSRQAMLAEYDACFHCMGVSAAGMSEEKYTTLTHLYSMALAISCYKANSKMTFIYVSGTGTDSTEKGRAMWARVKGKTENDILKLGFKQAFMFRPGAIRPLRGIKSRTRLYRNIYRVMSPFWPVFKALMGKNLTDTVRIGKAMINAVDKGNSEIYLENPQINSLAAKS
ncbi:MAG: NAD-dependent epimerase/dehydratase family protein [Bacteroidetes bacterium]|nr:NAD-dependent epimerase/dehydratase family protein [Bacteroidota bacterium]